jgi:hypothetical protein
MMKMGLIICILGLVWSPLAEILASTENPNYHLPGPTEVHIGPNAIHMPLGRILLVRRGSEHCAVKFNAVWTGVIIKGNLYAAYESAYQADGTGDFTKSNVQHWKGKLRWTIGISVGGGHRLRLFARPDVECGPIKLFWSYKTWVSFSGSEQGQGDFGIELAPTKWTDFSEINVFDRRLKWYRYDENREDKIIEIDQLWPD